MAGRSEAVLLSLLLLLVPSQSRNTGLHPGSVVILNPTGAPLPTDIPVRDSSETPNVPAKDQTGAGSTEASASSTFANVATEDSPGNVPTNLPADVPTSLPTKLATDVAKTEQYNLDKNETGSFTSPVPESSPMSTYPPSTSKQQEIFNDQTTILSTDAVTVPPTDRSSTAAATDTSPPPEDPKGPSCAAPDLPRWRPVPKTHRLRLSRANRRRLCGSALRARHVEERRRDTDLLVVGGTDEDPGSTFKCYCLPGYGGDLCEFEYDECDSGPCSHGAQCEDLVAGFRCHCGPGYAGRACEIKVDLCRPDPCPPPAQCVDRGNNYSCLCHPGYDVHLSGSEPGCSGQAAWLLNVSVHARECSKSPQDSDTCSGGGACVLEPGQTSFSCRCCPGLRNRFCEERDGCFTRPCRNGGYCVDIAEGLTGTMFQCLCLER
ncbi:neurogenic locus notch, putative [Ixodes scapularis]|uniref:Neurogenic locus notch, putative n=1 Tax=Ixodes scapularis TaxID=6945 RepID=B7PDF9_IXOSC|nr:neurogenic locus notch, putative [Ixodes scapularis]|eukprot:XP_002410793.1 neurogenic locus notch, putative [Ixodes scapularis]